MQRLFFYIGALAVLAGCQHSSPVTPGQPSPVAGQTCPQWVHDRYQVQGPDGQFYRTWHPPVDPEYGCVFGHEHGDDPRTSLANPTLPPFGYINRQAGVDEPHEGFKVFVANKGTVNDEGRVALTSSRIVAHMGTGGVGRFTRQHHSLIFDLVAEDGHRVHLQGMADTRLAGSICERDKRLNDGDPNNDIGRTVVTLPGTGCDVDSLYEIWTFSLDVGKATAIVSTAVFDPITVMDPADRSRLIPTKDVFPRAGDPKGCDREAYHGPTYWYNGSGPTVFYTDAYGKPGGNLRQEVSNHTDIGIPMAYRADGALNQFKYHRPTCASGIGAKN